MGEVARASLGLYNPQHDSSFTLFTDLILVALYSELPISRFRMLNLCAIIIIVYILHVVYVCVLDNQVDYCYIVSCCQFIDNLRRTATEKGGEKTTKGNLETNPRQK